MITLNNKKPVNIYDPAYDKLFENLQGNILKGHGRNFTSHIFLRFEENKKDKVKKCIASFANEITSCKKQIKENLAFKRDRTSGDTFIGFYISALGYSFLENFNSSEKETDFFGSMKDANISDIKPSDWESGFREDIHAMILVADDNLMLLREKEISIRKEMNGKCKIVKIENGNVIRNEDGAGIEHFGYADGISQPLFFSDEIQELETKYKDVKINYSSFFPLSQVLVEDPFLKNEEAFGSYLVFRKLEQDVDGFKAKEEKIASIVGRKTDDEKEEIGAIIVGRFEDGTPHILSHEEGIIDNLSNNFLHKNSSNGKCPFLNHIQATNQRDEASREMIMARRGIPYGIFPGEGREVGLLFMSFQSDIKKQFEATQIQANHYKDLIIGQNLPQKMNLDCFGKKGKEINVENFVKLRGGEYFFAPSIPYLKNV
ncbi:Dyp-type peroxidase [Chryseobacterium gambrini]|uniref:Dyp-type peroxidase n=1 Tax=Chryseobacterium gambrini TaxID=373672 RepID=UPI003BA70894